MKRDRNKKIATDQSYIWMSYSDLMAGLFLSFMLVFFSVYIKQKKNAEKALELENKINKMSNVQQNIKSELNDIVYLLKKNKKCKEVNFNIANLTITASSVNNNNFWFDSGEAEVHKKGEGCLKSIAEFWAENLYKNENFINHVSRLTIDGHTNSEPIRSGSPYYNKDSFISNMKLSQDRATSAMEVVLNYANKNKEFRKWLENTMTANGRSFSKLIYNEDGLENKSKSIRVEFSVTLNSFIAKRP